MGAILTYFNTTISLHEGKPNTTDRISKVVYTFLKKQPELEGYTLYYDDTMDLDNTSGRQYDYQGLKIATLPTRGVKTVKYNFSKDFGK